jgi:hypothetical protein
MNWIPLSMLTEIVEEVNALLRDKISVGPDLNFSRSPAKAIARWVRMIQNTGVKVIATATALARSRSGALALKYLHFPNQFSLSLQ